MYACVSQHKHSLREHSNVLECPTASRVLSYCARGTGQSKMKAPTVQPRPTRVGRLFTDARLIKNDTIGIPFRSYAMCSAMCSKNLGSGSVHCSTFTDSLRDVLSHVLQSLHQLPQLMRLSILPHQLLPLLEQCPLIFIQRTCRFTSDTYTRQTYVQMFPIPGVSPTCGSQILSCT